jgi:hypothetical protein
MEIRTSYEGKRGCGYRQPGGKYLVSGGTLAPCDRLPVELELCPTCHAGIKVSRSWTWIDADAVLAETPCEKREQSCAFCFLCSPKDGRIGKAGLLWIGEKFYPTPGDWLREAATMGVSRRIPAVPHGFKLGETIILVAHRKAIPSVDVAGEERPRLRYLPRLRPDRGRVRRQEGRLPGEAREARQAGLHARRRSPGRGAGRDRATQYGQAGRNRGRAVSAPRRGPEQVIEFPATGLTYTRDEFGVYEYGRYPRGSVLAGRERRVYLDAFRDLESAIRCFPKAIVTTNARREAERRAREER